MTDTLVSTERMVRVSGQLGLQTARNHTRGRQEEKACMLLAPLKETGLSWLSGRLLVKVGTSSLLTVTSIPTNVLSIFWASLGCTQTTDHRLDTSDSQKLASAPFGDQGNP